MNVPSFYRILSQWGRLVVWLSNEEMGNTHSQVMHGKVSVLHGRHREPTSILWRRSGDTRNGTRKGSYPLVSQGIYMSLTYWLSRTLYIAISQEGQMDGLYDLSE